MHHPAIFHGDLLKLTDILRFLVFFEMACLRHLGFSNIGILRVGRVNRVKLSLHAKFRSDR